jgi:hypothetical protein
MDSNGLRTHKPTSLYFYLLLSKLLAKVKLININKFAAYAKHVKVTQLTIDYYHALTTK